MKKLVAIAALLLMGTGAANAAPIVSVVSYAAGAGLQGYTFSIDPNDLLNAYDTVNVTITADPAGTLNNNGNPVKFPVASGAFSGLNGALAFAPGANFVGQAVTANALVGAIATLGNNNMSSAVFQIADAVLTQTGVALNYRFEFANDGTNLGFVAGRVPEGPPEPVVPEPSTLLIGVGLFGLVSGRKYLIRGRA